MRNPYLDVRSEVFADDTFESVEKRCIVALCGKTSGDPAISIEVGFNAFDDARAKKTLVLDMHLDHFLVEYNNEILKNLTNLGLEYRILFNFMDLKMAPKANAKNKKRTL